MPEYPVLFHINHGIGRHNNINSLCIDIMSRQTKLQSGQYISYKDIIMWGEGGSDLTISKNVNQNLKEY